MVIKYICLKLIKLESQCMGNDNQSLVINTYFSLYVVILSPLKIFQPFIFGEEHAKGQILHVAISLATTCCCGLSLVILS